MPRRPSTADEANRQTLADCRLHDFERVGEAGDWRCRACGGVVTTADQFFYREGLEHANRGRETRS